MIPYLLAFIFSLAAFLIGLRVGAWYAYRDAIRHLDSKLRPKN